MRFRVSHTSKGTIFGMVMMKGPWTSKRAPSAAEDPEVHRLVLAARFDPPFFDHDQDILAGDSWGMCRLQNIRVRGPFCRGLVIL